MPKFLIIVFTLPDFFNDEGTLIEKLLDSGVDFVHIRKPQCSPDKLESLILSISQKYRNRLKLHDHFDLAEKYGLGGVQLNSRNPYPPTNGMSVSKSCHTLTELAEKEDNYNYDYVTLSPIFDSISKAGYASNFDLKKIERKIKHKNVIALGGVTLRHIRELIRTGFHGAAMLGYAWNNVDLFINELNKLKPILSVYKDK